MLLTEGENETLAAEIKGASRNSSGIVGTPKPSWVSFTTLLLMVPKYQVVEGTRYLVSSR